MSLTLLCFELYVLKSRDLRKNIIWPFLVHFNVFLNYAYFIYVQKKNKDEEAGCWLCWGLCAPSTTASQSVKKENVWVENREEDRSANKLRGLMHCIIFLMNLLRNTCQVYFDVGPLSFTTATQNKNLENKLPKSNFVWNEIRNVYLPFANKFVQRSVLTLWDLVFVFGKLLIGKGWIFIYFLLSEHCLIKTAWVIKHTRVV